MYSNVLFNSYSNKTMNNRLANMFMNFIAICILYMERHDKTSIYGLTL